jgi:pilus assembly protein Flp/PilA
VIDCSACTSNDRQTLRTTFAPVVATSLFEKEVNYMLKFFVATQNKVAELRNEEGQTMAEYGVVLAVITVVLVGIFGTLSGAIQGAIQQVIDAF